MEIVLTSLKIFSIFYHNIPTPLPIRPARSGWVIEQINLLKNRGLSFENEARALNLFEYISYYRLSNYWHPFLKDKQNKVFNENANFHAVFELYKFDTNLRKITMEEIEKIEIAVRSKMAYVLSLSNDSFWLENENLFSCSKMYAALMLSILAGQGTPCPYIQKLC